MSKAWVYLGDQLVGELRAENENIAFVYDPEWRKNGFAISHSLPLSGEFESVTAHRFFANLLPEATLRQLICRKLKISPDNDWELLLALGKESAGALIITQEPITEAPQTEYQKLSREEIDRYSRQKTVMPLIVSEEATRLSLAGAQDKLALYFDGTDYWLPLPGSPTNVIFKFDNENYRQITVNEVFLTRLAGAVGLPTVKSRIYTESRQPIAVFDRYDRQTKAGKIHRRHQEDLCQALGVSSQKKYQKEGGPSFKRALETVSQVSENPLQDRRTLIRWQIFNILCGNSDGHSKNLSFFRDRQGCYLTPVYDLVCTRVYPSIDRKMAMSFADNYDPDLLDAVRVEKWAEEIGVGRKFLCDEVLDLAELLQERLSEVEKTFIAEFGSHGVLEQVRLFVGRQCKKSVKAVK